jgi:hypothetical protein
MISAGDRAAPLFLFSGSLEGFRFDHERMLETGAKRAYRSLGTT